MMTILDWLALIGYLVIICGVGVFFSRRNRNFGEYMFGGGRMPWFAIGISLIATSVSATTFLGNPADAYGTNMTYLMCNLGAFLAIIIVAFVFIPRFRALNASSAYEVLELRFSKKVRVLASCFYAAHLLLRTGVLLYGPAIVLSKIFGINIFLAISLTSILAVVYTWFGGLQAVVWTDVLQFVVLMGGGCAALWFCVQEIGSFSEMARLASEAGKTKWLDLNLDPSQARTLLSAGLVYTVFEVAIRGCDQQFVQRYMACKNVREANMSSILSAFLGLLVGLVFFWVGAALYVYFQVKGVRTLPADMDINHVFPHFILEVLPSGLTGLLAAAIFAAAMSSLDSAITALSNTTVQDFFPGASDEGDSSRLKRARFWVVVWGVAGTLAAFLCVAGKQSLLSKALFFTSLFTGPLLSLFLFAFFRPNTQARALFWGAIGGALCLLPFSKIPILSIWEPIYQFAWPWNPLIALTGAICFTLILERFGNWNSPHAGTAGS